jgi:hypothetical protein
MIGRTRVCRRDLFPYSIARLFEVCGLYSVPRGRDRIWVKTDQSLLFRFRPSWLWKATIRGYSRHRATTTLSLPHWSVQISVFFNRWDLRDTRYRTSNHCVLDGYNHRAHHILRFLAVISCRLSSVPLFATPNDLAGFHQPCYAQSNVFL